MSKEISIGATISFKKTGAQVSRSESITVDVTGDAFSHEVLSILTTVTTIVEGGDLGTAGYVFLKNLDTTNYITVGLSGQYSIKLKAGEIALFRAAAPIYALANTATCLLEYLIIED